MTSTCTAKTASGSICQRTVKIGEEHCWQHSQGLRRKWHSLTRNQSTAFVIAITGILLSILAWYFPQAWDTRKPNFVDVWPVIWRDRPDEISFTIGNNGLTAINNIVIVIHDRDAAAAWASENSRSGQMTGTVDQFDATTTKTFEIGALSPSTVVTRTLFYSLSGFTVRRFIIDIFAGDETSRLLVKAAKVNGQWLIATLFSRRIGGQQLQPIENIPSRFPRNADGKVNFN